MTKGLRFCMHKREGIDFPCTQLEHLQQKIPQSLTAKLDCLIKVAAEHLILINGYGVPALDLGRCRLRLKWWWELSPLDERPLPSLEDILCVCVWVSGREGIEATCTYVLRVCVVCVGEWGRGNWGYMHICTTCVCVCRTMWKEFTQYVLLSSKRSTILIYSCLNIHNVTGVFIDLWNIFGLSTSSTYLEHS